MDDKIHSITSSKLREITYSVAAKIVVSLLADELAYGTQTVD